MGIFSNKMLLGLAGGAAALSLVGVGAGASFTGVAKSTSQVQMGHVGVQVSANDATYASYSHTNNNFNVDNTAGNYGFQLTTSSPVDSSFAAEVPVQIKNSGNVNIHGLSLAVADSSNVPGASQKAFENATDVNVYYETSAWGTLATSSNLVKTTTLAKLVSTPLAMNNIPTITPGNSLYLYITTAPNNSQSPPTDVPDTYGNQFSNTLIDLTWTVTASDA